MKRRFVIAGLLASFAASTAIAPAVAQTDAYPNRQIRLIVPFAPGGAVDVFGRLIAEKIKAKHNALFIVENRSGGSGTIGGSEVQRSTPDGYTLLFSASTHVMARQVMRNAPYDPIADFVPIALAGTTPLILVMAPNRPEKTLQEVVAAARANPSQWTIGVPSLGAAGHLGTVAFIQAVGKDLAITAYRGTAPALNDVAGGHTQLLTDAALPLLPMIQSGGIKALAISTAKRSAIAPSIPTATEGGVPNLNFGSWYGVWGPPGLPADIVKTMNAWVNEAVADLAAEGRLTPLAMEPGSGTPEQFAEFAKVDLARGTELLKAAKFQPE